MSPFIFSTILTYYYILNKGEIAMLAIVGVIVIVGALVGIGVSEQNTQNQPVKPDISQIQSK